MGGQVIRTKDAQYLNEVANLPNVYPMIHGPIDGPLDLTPLVTDENIVLKMAGGAFLFVRQQPTVYEVHTLFPAGRGVLLASEQAAKYMFLNTACEVVTTTVPASNAAARRLTEAMGFQFSHRDGEWPTDSGPVPIDHYFLTVKRWVQTRFTCPQPFL